MMLVGFPFWLAFVATVLAMGVFGIALERVVIRPILGQPAFTLVMLTIGIGYVARGLVTMIPGIGTETHTLPVPYKDQIWNVGALVLNVEQMVVIGATAVLCAALLRDVPLHPGRHRDAGLVAEPARRLLHGHPGARLNGLVWGLAAAVAAVAGLLLAPDHLRPRQHGLHRPEGDSRGGRRRLRQPARARSSAASSSASSNRSPASTCPRASRTSRRTSSCCSCSWSSRTASSARSCARRSKNSRCASSSRPATSRTSAWPSTAGTCSGTACWCWRCSPRPGSFAEYWLAQLTFVLIYSVVGLGLMLLSGFTGLFSLGHAAFLGVGAYTEAALVNAGVPFPHRAGGGGAALGGGRRRRRPAGAARQGHLPGDRDDRLRLHRRRGVRALGERDRRQRRHARQAARAVRLERRLGPVVLFPLPRRRRDRHPGHPQPAALADRPRLRRHPRLRDLGAEHGHPPGALQDAVVRDLGGAGRHRRRALRAQAEVHLARPVRHPAVDRPGADDRGRRRRLGARRLPRARSS